MPLGEGGHPRRFAQLAPLRVFIGHDEAGLEAEEAPPDDMPSRGLRLHFTLPAGSTVIRLASPLRSHEVDTRQLGVAIQRIEIDDRAVALNGPEIRSGFYRLEESGNVAWRWTNGDAVVEVPELAEPARLVVAVTPWSLPPVERPQGRRVAVVSWDVAHNPVGRAHVLYRLLQRDWRPELVGPALRRFGDGLWPPLRAEGIALRSFPAETLADVWTEGTILALSHRYDLVVVSKPRLPGLLLGLLLAEQSRCPIIVDTDESEQAFMGHHGAGTALDRASLLAEPFGALGTELAVRLLDVADARTASGPLLQMEHGGHLVRHARDEAARVPERAQARRRLGFADGDFVVAFVGTIRPHKGLATVLAAIEAADDPALRLLLVGPVHDAALRARLAAQPPGRVVHHEGASLGALGEYLVAADLVPLLQDPAARIAQSQVPAKLADALQHGVPVVATDVPPLRDLARRGVVDLIGPQDFAGYLKAAMTRGHSPERARAARRVFESEFGLEVNRARLGLAIDEALAGFNPVRPRAADALAVLRRETRRAMRPPIALPPPPRGAQDLVFFWKQNDSGLFGRRSDMVAKYLRRSGRFRQVLHFDLPLHMFDLRNMARAQDEGRGSTGAMQARGSIARAIGLADEPGLHRALMLTHSLDNESTLAGQRTHDPDDFAAFVLARMREHGMAPETTLAWVCPVVWGFGEMARRLGFARVVVDLVDDQRSWKMDAARRARMEAEYAATLGCADLVLTNCAGNRARFLARHPDIHVVPNGAEFGPPDAAAIVPAALAALKRPILGYVGNLRDRVDWDLVSAIAAARPDWSIALLGPRDNPEAGAAMACHANVHLPGPVDYETMRACLPQFDVAIVPHKVDAMTDAMNPLKVYNYLAAGRKVVATEVANLDDVGDLIVVAKDAPGFIAAVEQALAQDAAPALSAERQAALSWSGRVAAMLRLLDGTSRPLRDEGEGGGRQPLRLVGDNARRQADPGEAVEKVAAELGVDQ
jgi:glycosyltransferase involved in cell wall biosynthesis